MNSCLQTEVGGDDLGWTRVSSFKPHLAAVFLIAMVSAALLILLREHNSAGPLIAASAVVAFGLAVA